jgi:uncharacterized phage protein gp47/JayE
MPTVTYDDLITPLTREAVVTTMLDVLRALDFPVDSYLETDEARASVEAEAEALVGLSEQIAAIGKMGVLADADGDALTLHAQDVYDIEREAAVALVGGGTLTDSTASPQTFADGELLFASTADPDLVFKNQGAVTVPGSGSVAVVLVAESPGSDYNVSGSTLSFATPIPGLTFTPDATDQTWATTAGTDEETDARLRTRCETQWGSLNANGSYDSYVYNALAADSTVTRVRVQEDPGAVYPDPAVTVIFAINTGAPGGALVTTVTTYIEARRPLGVLVETIGATGYTLPVRGTVYVRAAYQTAATAAINSALQDFYAEADIGASIYVSEIVESIMAVAGVTRVTLTDSAGTALEVGAIMPVTTAPGSAPALNAVASLSNLLTYTAV